MNSADNGTLSGNTKCTPTIATATATATMRIHNCSIRTQKYWWGEEGAAQNLVNKNRNNTDPDPDQDSNNGLIILVADCVLPKLYPIEPLVKAIDDCIRHYEDKNKTKNWYQERSRSDSDSGTNTTTTTTTTTTNNEEQRASVTRSESKSACAIVAYEYRYYQAGYDPKTEFIKLATHKYGLRVVTVPTEHLHPIYSTDDIEIWIVSRQECQRHHHE